MEKSEELSNLHRNQRKGSFRALANTTNKTNRSEKNMIGLSEGTSREREVGRVGERGKEEGGVR